MWSTTSNRASNNPPVSKKTELILVFIGDGVGEKFLHEIRRVATTADFFRVCENHLASDEPMTLEPVSISEAALDLPATF
jgi:hypothetical protein